MLCVCPKGTVTVDWGDGTTPDVLTGNDVIIAQYTPIHNYASAGDYVITLTVDGEMSFISSSGYIGLLIHPDIDIRSYAYKYAIRKVEIGTGVTGIGSNAFSNYYGLTNIVIPDSVTSIDSDAFNGCYHLINIVISDSVTSIGSNAFRLCYSLVKIRFEGATPPSAGSSGTFGFIPSDCIISVPVGCLEAYTTATNYPSATTYTYVEE